MKDAWQGWLGLAVCLSCAAVLIGAVAGGFLDRVAWRAVHGRGCRPAPGPARTTACRVAGALLYLFVLWHYGLTLQALEMAALASALLVASVTDLDDYLIPNGCIVAAVATRAVYLAACAALGWEVAPLVRESLIGAVAVTVPLALLVLVMDRVLGRPSMGGGDLKLFAVAGLYFGWRQCLFLILVACALGLVFALVSQRLPQRGTDARGRADGAEPAAGAEPSEPGLPFVAADEPPARAFPFGPSIAAAMVITMLCGHQVLAWYSALFF